jgi:hypothetical protein
MFIFQGGRMRQGKGVVSSFWLVPKNKGSWIFLQVEAYELGGWSLLLVGSREVKEFYLPSG